MAYHAHDSEDHILTCPDCGSAFVHPVLTTDTIFNGYYKGMVKSLYNEANPEDYGNNFHEDYVDKHGHEPLKRQNHFFCEPCMDNYLNNEYGYYDFDYLPIHPYHKLTRLHVSDIKPAEIENPYSHFIKKR